jgi:hypothetical protein
LLNPQSRSSILLDFIIFLFKKSFFILTHYLLFSKKKLRMVYELEKNNLLFFKFYNKRKILGTRLWLCSQNILIFFLLKFNIIYMFWIVLMCWCQKWFLKNEKTSLTCILTRKVIWKAPATTLSNTLFISQVK